MSISPNYSDNLDEIKLYLPKYLSLELTEDLFKSISKYIKSDHEHNDIYSLEYPNDLLQGDGIEGLPFSNYPDEEFTVGRGMIVSNSCDISSDNDRLLPIRLQYCPIFKMSKFIKMLEKKHSEERILNLINSIKKQKLSNIFYLPSIPNLDEECIVLFDRSNNCNPDIINPKDINKHRKFSLNNFGFYIFLIKLSIHFTRIRESVDRG